jgi:cyclopropane fatty-acyl-phospholipid synthase-like methyltransferase/3-oxoacyl-(acyl-carrier-protein) synthase
MRSIEVIANPGASRRAIQSHYDIGNDFYRLWLDRDLNYSAAMWEPGDMLDAAQLRKVDYHISQAGAECAERVLDVGCGWGAVLRRLVEARGARRAVGLTLSNAQADWIRSWGNPQIEVRVESWSDHHPTGQYDAIISIGAFEHFAKLEASNAEKVEGYRAFFALCRDWLKPQGRLSLQTFAYGSRRPREEVRNSAGTRFLATEIFPETDPPRLIDIAAAIEGCFEVVSLRNDFPGADSPAALWKLLQDGRDAITEVPGDRWNVDDYYDPVPATPGKMHTRWGGFLDQVDCFDAEFFGISAREACCMDPQQRLVLEVTWEALESAGIVPDRLAGSRTGVFIGISNFDYNRLLCRDFSTMDAYSSTGTILAIAANRLSYLLNLRGPSLAVDTACSSSLVTVHLACQSLRCRESDLALAGGVNLILSPEVTIILSQGGLMSARGRCHTFDENADGYVRSEGCGVVVLKRLSDALRDGDRIRALLRGSAVNQDGGTNGLTAPSATAQQAVIRDALANAEVASGQISYVEAHGSGTRLGDIIEFRALKAVLLASREPDHRCAICEYSWVLEDNTVMLRSMETLGATRYKTYRIYEWH